MTMAKKTCEKKSVKSAVKTADKKMKTMKPADKKMTPHHCGCMFNHDR